MNRNNKNPAMLVWYIAYPFLFYYAVSVITMALCQLVFGNDTSHFVECQLFSTVITIPFMLPFYRQDRAILGKGILKTWKKEFVTTALRAVMIAACLGVAINNIISMTPLVEISAGYKEANAGFYSSTLILELISSALMTPVLEELVFRGILFGRLRQIMPKLPAIVVSSLIFACVHFNVVQFIYAFLLGMVLALLVEREDHVYPAIIGHVTANLIAVVRTELHLMERTVDSSVFAWSISIILLCAGILFLFGSDAYKSGKRI